MAFLSPLIPFFSKTKFITRETNVVSKHVTRKEILFFYRFYTNFHQIIAQSDDMKKDLIENFKINPSKIIKINNPVDFEMINELKDEIFEQDYNKSYIKIVSIGNLSQRKGFDLLLNVFQYLKNEPIKLTIFGDGRDKAELLQQKSDLQLENVSFFGKVNNPFPFVKQADLFILSSRYEGFPNVLLEAGACGTYSLANNCPGGINEIIQQGINGEIYDINDAEGFANKIKEILDKSYDKENIIESIESRFSKKVIINQYESLFEKL